MTDLALNKKAEFDYFVEDRIEAGLVLEGWEVKSIKAKKLNLDGSFIKVRDGEAFLYNAQVVPLNTVTDLTNVEPTRARKLLLKRSEIDKLVSKVDEKGFTLVPLRVYQSPKIKVMIGVAKGKKQHDKRQVLKDKDWVREKAQLTKQAARG